MMSSSTVVLASAMNKTPMTMLVMIISNSVIISLLCFASSMDPWTSVLLMMVYVSGIMILFMYIVSLSPIGKPKTNKMNTIIIFSLVVMILPSWSKISAQPKQLNKFYTSFEKYLNMVIILMAMMVVMGSIIPKISMTNFKGLKTSD